VISAFHQLQNLHQQWREIGPVSRKDREEIWNRFKEASNKINKKYQAHFEEIKLQENENLEKKTAICEQLESIDYSALTTQKAWREQLDKVLALQDEWRKIGYVPKKWNSKIYERYRAACNIFFEKKNQFQKSIRDELDENLRKKTALCEQAEALKDSKDWRTTTQEMIRIQKEWKEIGPVPRKFVDRCGSGLFRRATTSSNRKNYLPHRTLLKNKIIWKPKRQYRKNQQYRSTIAHR
jgi:ATP-dependent Lon protease